MIISNILTGCISNRLRGCKTNVLFLGQDDINGILFATIFSTTYWHIPILYLSMKLGSATGWSEFLNGCSGRYVLPDTADYTWISKIIPITGQFSTFLWGCLRSSIWVYILQVGLYFTIGLSTFLWVAIPGFYLSYRLGLYLSKKLPYEYIGIAEVIYGGLLWGLITN